MLKNDNFYVINGQSARFTATVTKTSTGVAPTAVFVFPDGESISVVHNSLTGTSTASGLMDRAVAYRNGSWRFL